MMKLLQYVFNLASRSCLFLDQFFEMTLGLERAISIFLSSLAQWKLRIYFISILMHVRPFTRSFKLMLTWQCKMQSRIRLFQEK